jgi:hypothetical protein
MIRVFLSALVCSTIALAQDAPLATDQASALPQAGSAEARDLVSRTLDKLASFGRGSFSSTESQDQAMLRNAGLPVGMSDTEVSGGWHRHVVWGEADGREYLTANGRMMAMVDGEWRLRRNKLSGGQPAPFTLDPDYLVTVIKRMPSAARGVVHVEVGKLRGKAMTLLTIKLEDEVALEFADSGAAPDVGGAFSSMMIMGGIAGMEPPRPELETYLVFYVDAASGELARIAIRTYSTDAMMGNIQIAGGFVGEEEEEEEEEEGELTDDGKPAEVKWKRGLPRVKPAKDQSVMTYRVDFRDLGQAQAPELDEPSRRLLRVR